MTQINVFFAGDTLDVTRTVLNVPPADPIVKAWFTVKGQAVEPDSAAVLQKVVTTALVAGVGQITADGSPGNGAGTGGLIFNLLAADTALLQPNRPYPFDVKVKLVSGKLYTVDAGTVMMLQKVTAAIT